MSSPSHETQILELKLGDAPTILLGGQSEGERRTVQHERGAILSFLAGAGGVSLASPESSSYSVAWEGSCLRLLARAPLEINGRPVAAGARRVLFAGDRISAGGSSLEISADSGDLEELWCTSVGADPEANELQAEIDRARREPARHLERYLLLNELGRGGFGCVYRAYDPKLERVVAIKILTQMSGHALQRFEREAKVTAGFQHPNIVRLLDSGSHKGLPYFVMEYVRGRSLEAHADEVLLRLPPEERARQALDITATVADALAHAHTHGVLHRDLKPANILVSDDGTPFVVDFGLARQDDAEERLTLTGTTLGTPLFMPLQQLVGEELDARADVYALGATYFCILTGSAPRLANSPAEMFDAHRKEAPPPSKLVPELPAACDRIARLSLATDPSDRYDDMDAMAADLRVARAELDLPVARALTWAIGGAVVTIALGVGAYSLRPSDPAPAPTPTTIRRATPDVAVRTSASPTPTTTPSPAPEARVEALLVRARRFLERSQVRQATLLLEEATRLSKAVEPARALARARVLRGSSAEIEAAAVELARRGDPAGGHRVRIGYAIRLKKVALAAEHLGRLLALPNPPLADRVLEANISFLQGKGKLTLKRLNRILAANPDHVPALLLRARLFLAAKRFPRSEQSLVRVQALKPLHPAGLALRAKLRAAQGRDAEALEDFLRALESGSRHERVWEVLDGLRKKRALLEPILKRGLAPLIEREPDLAFPRIARFLVRADLRRPLQEAALDLDEVIRRDQAMVPRALYLRGMFRIQSKRDPLGGREDLKRFLSLAPDEPGSDHARRVLGDD